MDLLMFLAQRYSAVEQKTQFLPYKKCSWLFTIIWAMAPAFLVGMVIVVQQFQRDSGSDAGSWIYGFRKCEFAVVFSFLSGSDE